MVELVEMSGSPSHWQSHKSYPGFFFFFVYAHHPHPHTHPHTHTHIHIPKKWSLDSYVIIINIGHKSDIGFSLNFHDKDCFHYFPFCVFFKCILLIPKMYSIFPECVAYVTFLFFKLPIAHSLFSHGHPSSFSSTFPISRSPPLSQSPCAPLSLSLTFSRSPLSLPPI